MSLRKPLCQVNDARLETTLDGGLLARNPSRVVYETRTTQTVGNDSGLVFHSPKPELPLKLGFSHLV